MEWRLRRVVPAAAVTTHAKPHAQQQLARELEVERAAPASRFRRCAARQSAATSMAVFLVNSSSAAVKPTYVVLEMELTYPLACPEI